MGVPDWGWRSGGDAERSGPGTLADAARSGPDPVARANAARSGPGTLADAERSGLQAVSEPVLTAALVGPTARKFMSS
jgi:hypothetical protein